MCSAGLFTLDYGQERHTLFEGHLSVPRMFSVRHIHNLLALGGAWQHLTTVPGAASNSRLINSAKMCKRDTEQTLNSRGHCFRCEGGVRQLTPGAWAADDRCFSTLCTDSQETVKLPFIWGWQANESQIWSLWVGEYRVSHCPPDGWYVVDRMVDGLLWMWLYSQSQVLKARGEVAEKAEVGENQLHMS